MNAKRLAGALPSISVLRDRCRALAMIEAIVSPEWESRYYSFDAAWGPGEEMASMRNGSGDAFSVVFGAQGAFIRGIDHESPMSPVNNDGDLWPGLVDDVPAVFLPQVNEPAFSYDGQLDATFCIWRHSTDAEWHTGDIEYPDFDSRRADPDGSSMLTILCASGPQPYLAFAEDYYGSVLDSGAATHIWALRPLDDATVAALNPALVLSDVRQCAHAAAYPIA